MDIKNIIIVIVIIVLLYIVIRYVFSDVNTLSNLTSGTTLQNISASSLASGSVSNSSNFTYSIWFYINDWNYKYGDPKVLYGRMGELSNSSGISLNSISQSEPCPAVILGAIENNLSINLTCYPGTASALSNTEKPQLPTPIKVPDK